MPAKLARSDPQSPFGCLEWRQRKGRPNVNTRANSGLIWGSPAQCIDLEPKIQAEANELHVKIV